MIRVFVTRTAWTPDDERVFVGDMPLGIPADYPPSEPVRVSVTFTWDKREGERLGRSWGRYFTDVQVGGPAFSSPVGEFEPGRFIKRGGVITSRGCPKKCPFCFVPVREGNLRELEVKDGWNVMDNNLLACSRDHVEKVFEMLRRQDHQIHFTGGMDKTLLEPWHVELLKGIRLKRAWFAMDSPEHFKSLERAGDLLSDLPREAKYCYVLVGYLKEDTPEAAEERLIKVHRLGFMPMSLLYRGPDALKRMHPSPAWRALVKKWSRPASVRAFMRTQQQEV